MLSARNDQAGTAVLRGQERKHENGIQRNFDMAACLDKESLPALSLQSHNKMHHGLRNGFNLPAAASNLLDLVTRFCFRGCRYDDTRA